jgi:hypothetical protein
MVCHSWHHTWDEDVYRDLEWDLKILLSSRSSFFAVVVGVVVIASSLLLSSSDRRSSLSQKPAPHRIFSIQTMSESNSGNAEKPAQVIPYLSNFS